MGKFWEVETPVLVFIPGVQTRPKLKLKLGRMSFQPLLHIKNSYHLSLKLSPPPQTRVITNQVWSKAVEAVGELVSNH